MIIYLRNIYYLSNINLLTYFGLVILFMFMTIIELIAITYLALIMKEISQGSLFVELPQYVPEIFFGGTQVKFTTMALCMIVLFLFKALLDLCSNFLIIKKTAKSQYDIKMKIFSKIGNQSLKKDTQSLSEKIISSQLLTSQFQNILNLLIRGAGDLIFAMAISVYLLTIINQSIMLLIVLSGIIIFIVVRFLNKIVRISGQNTNSSNIESTTHLEGYVRGIKEITVYRGQNYFIDLLDRCSLRFYYSIQKKQFIQILPKIFIEIIFIVFLTILIFMVVGNKNEESNENFFLIIVILLRLIPLIKQFINLLSQINFAKDSILRLIEILNPNHENIQEDTASFKHTTKQYNSEQTFQSLEGLNIKKAYSGKELFNNFNFDVRQGEIIGIIGPSGSGKTTLIDIICGFVSMDSGVLIHNGKEVSSRKLRHNLDSNIGYVSQHPVVFQGSILENIIFKNEIIDSDKEHLLSILEKLDFLKLFTSDDVCLSFKVSEMGNNLSGGMKQRIAIARALYFHRELVILDEPSSNLDTVSTNSLIKLLKSLTDCTFMIVTHDTSFNGLFDKIYRLDDK